MNLFFLSRQGNSFFNSGDVGVNCQLSNVSPQSLLSQDLISDPSWDVYEPDDKGQCGSGGGGTGTGGKYLTKRNAMAFTVSENHRKSLIEDCERSELFTF